MDLLQRLVGEEAEPGVRHNTQDGGGEASVQRLQPLFSGYPHKHVQNVAVPAEEKNPGIETSLFVCCREVSISFGANCTVSSRV